MKNDDELDKTELEASAHYVAGVGSEGSLHGSDVACGRAQAKPRPWHPEGAAPVVLQNIEDKDAMKLRHVALMAALGVLTFDTPSAVAGEIPSRHETPTMDTGPAWPNNGIAERKLGEDDGAYPEHMFVEHGGGKWHAWVLSSNVQGPVNALDFFSGEVLRNVHVDNPGGYNDKFIDARGVVHQDVISPPFHFMDPRPGAALSGIAFGYEGLNVKGTCESPWIDVSQRTSEGGNEVIWEKIAFYQSVSKSEKCPSGRWDAMVGTALDLRDGTMLVTAGKYIFRIRNEDMSPAGSAPHLRVVNAEDVRTLLRRAKDEGVEDESAFLIDRLRLP